MKNKYDAIDEILINTDWEKIHKTMEVLNWKWSHSQTESKIPSMGELFIQAKKMLYDVIVLAESKEDNCIISTGGFTALAFYDNLIKQIYNLKLIFQITSWDVDLNEDDESYF